MKASQTRITELLDRGAVKQIASKLGISSQAVGLALKVGKPNHPAVREAIKMIEESGVLAAAQKLAEFPQVA